MERMEYLLTMLAMAHTGMKPNQLPWRRANIDAFMEAVRRGG